MTGETTKKKSPERSRRVLDVFEQAISLDPAERETFLDSACGGDALLRQTVDEMIAASQQAEAEDFMETPVISYSPPDADPIAMIGQQVGSYRLTQFIAEGGMGVVYLAEPADNFFRRQAAVKLIRADIDPEEYRRFRREAQILADLKHPNLVFLYEAGRMPDGQPYLAMEYIKGETLRDWLQMRGAMPIAMVAEVVKQAAAGLNAAHSAAIIHRDIKPGNIIISEAGGNLAVKVLDFGIAARNDADNITASFTEGVVGTVLYMSPEQLQGKRRDELTPASDIYSLGLTVYELLTGQRAKHLGGMPVPPSQLRPDLKLPAAVDRVVMKALAKDPNERYQNAPDFAAELEAAFRGDKHSGEKNGYKKAAAAVVAVGIVTAASYFVWQREQTTTDPSPQTAASPSPVSSPQPRMLKLLLTVENTKGEPLSAASLALFKEGITTPPEKISTETALILRTDNQGRAETKTSEVKPGTYLMKAVRVGYKSMTDTVTLSEDRARPGTVKLVVTLEPE